MIKEKILQGDIWIVDFNPTIGDEMNKVRPAVVINGDFAIGLNLKIVIPITKFKSDFDEVWWLYKLISNKINGLNEDSVANCFQIRSVSHERFIRKLGNCKNDIEEIVSLTQNCLEAR